MTLQQKIITVLLISPSLCISMNTPLSLRSTLPFEDLFPEKQFINFDSMPDDDIQNDFKAKWRYSIPEKLALETVNKKSVYKPVSQSYIEAVQNNKAITLEVLDTFNPTLKINIQETNTLYTEKELLEKHLQRLEQLQKEIIASHKQNAQQKLGLARLKQIAAAHKTRNAQQKKAAMKKKKAFYVAVNNNKPIIQNNPLPQSNSNTSESQKKLTATLSLMTRYKVKTPCQLKSKMYEECDIDNCLGLSGRINQCCTWNYYKLNNELIIDTDDYESSDSAEDASSGSYSD